MTTQDVLARAQNQKKSVYQDIVRFDPLRLKRTGATELEPVIFIDAIGVEGEKLGQAHPEGTQTEWINLQDYEFAF